MPEDSSNRRATRTEERLLIGLVALLVALVLLMIVGGVFVYLQIRTNPQATLSPGMVSRRAPGTEPEYPTSGETIESFFLSPADMKLVAETRWIRESKTMVDRATRALETLLDGPDSSDLIATLPAQAKLLSVYHDPESRQLYVDFAAAFYRNLPGHSLAEWAAIYSVVNTLCSLTDEIQAVIFLEDGRPITSSPGNWNWDQPFRPDRAWVRYSAPGDEHDVEPE